MKKVIVLFIGLAMLVPFVYSDSLNDENAYLHLYGEMDRYSGGSILRLIQSYVGTSTNPNEELAWVYDNALVIIALTDRGTPVDMSRAKVLCDSLIWAQEHDQNFNDGRIRDGYWANNLFYGEVSAIKSPGSGVGNMAWASIALLRYYKATGDIKYLNAAKRLGNWIYDHTYDTRGAGGYTGGYEGKNYSWVLEKIMWKSTEHNIDAYVNFMKLYEAEGNSTWQERAMHANNFLESMWNEDEGHFWTGTTDNGTTVNKIALPADVNTWGLMALGNLTKYGRGITWVEENCLVDTCPKGCGFEGFDFNDDKDGVWFEGTAHTIIAFQIKNEINKSDFYLNEMRKAQVNATNNNGKGIVAACHDNLTTGFQWNYSNSLHIGATAWYIFAERKLNPYWGTRTYFNEWNISLLEGWNLISSPLNFTNLTEMFDPIRFDFGPVFAYDGEKYIEIEPFDNPEIDLRYGLWIEVWDNVTLTITGKRFENTDIPLVEGWNLIGCPYMEEQDIASLYDNVTVYMYNDSEWYSYGSDKVLNTLDKFTPGYGYWIKKI